MNKTILTALMVLGTSGAYANDCMVELQFEGSVLGQNTFIGQTCIDATRQCKRAEKTYERKYGFTNDELSCVRVGDIGPGNGGNNGGNNGGYNPGNGGNNGGNNGGYNPGNGNYDPTYSRTQALLDLEQIERSSNDASEAFDLIIMNVDQFKVSLRDGVDLYREITRIHNGPSSTTSTMQVFELLVNEASASQVDVLALAQSYDSMMIAERDMNQSIENVSLVASLAANNNVDIIQALDSFVVLLKMIGTDQTTSVRNVFSRIITIKRIMLQTAISDFQTMLNLESGVDDAIGNYDLVIMAASSPSIRYNEALQSMIDLLNNYGASSTSTVRSRFRQIYGI